MNIRCASVDDASAILEIYNWYVVNTTITFETDIITKEDMRQRISEKLTTHDWLIGEVNNKIIGYTYYSTFRPRAAYKHTIESTIYLSQASIGKGYGKVYGKVLYGRLIESIKGHGFREVIGVIALPNPGSICLHEKMGFVKIGVLRDVGYKFGKYIDIGLRQKSII